MFWESNMIIFSRLWSPPISGRTVDSLPGLSVYILILPPIWYPSFSTDLKTCFPTEAHFYSKYTSNASIFKVIRRLNRVMVWIRKHLKQKNSLITCSVKGLVWSTVSTVAFMPTTGSTVQVWQDRLKAGRKWSAEWSSWVASTYRPPA